MKTEKVEKVQNTEQLKQKSLKNELEKNEREERKRQLEMERKEKKEKVEREKEAKRIKLEAEKKAKLDQKLKEKEEQRLKREDEKRKRDEERRKKEEERQKKEEERQKKENERQKKLDEKRLLEEMKHRKELEEKEKKEKEQNRFRSFFKQDSKSSVNIDSQLNNGLVRMNTIFKPFQLQPNQSLAMLVPDYIKQRFDSNKLDELIFLQNADRNGLYLSKLQHGYKGHNLKMSNADDVMSLENDASQMKYKAKLFQFHENNRPPYFGTWRKKSRHISPRNPFAKDEIFNYDVDSDDEWEEDEKGESLKDNDSEISEEEGDGYELDDMFVSHGYLSDDELREDGADDADGTDGAADNRGGILVKEEVLLDEKKKPLKKLQPLVIGCVWRDTVSDKNSLKILEQYSATYLRL